MKCDNPNVLVEDETTGVSINTNLNDFLKQQNLKNKKDQEETVDSFTKKVEFVKNGSFGVKAWESFKNTLEAVGSTFNKVSNPKTNEYLERIAKNNPAVEATLRSIRGITKEFISEKIEEAKYVFITIQEYSALGKHLEDMSSKILEDLDNQKILEEEAFTKLRDIDDYYHDIANIASNLKEHIRKFVKNGNEPIYRYFSDVENSKETIRANVKPLEQKYVVESTQKNLPESKDINKGWEEVIRALNVKLLNAKAANDEKRIKELEAKIEEAHSKYITFDTLTDALNERGGPQFKTNWWSHYFEHSLNSSNPFVASVSKSLYLITHKSRNKMIPISEDIAKAWRAFIAGQDPTNLEKLYKGVYKWVNNYKYNRETDEIESVQELALVVWWDIEKLSKHEAEWEQKLHKAEGLEEKTKVEREYTKWRRETYQQEFNDKIENINALLIPEAKEKRDSLQAQIDLLNSELNYAFTKEKDLERFLLQKEKNSLKYEYDDFGNKKTGIDLEIAKSIQLYSKGWSEVYEKPTEEDTLNARIRKERKEETFNLYIDSLKRRFGYEGKSREDIDNLVKRWKSFNEVRVFKKEYEQEIGRIDKRIKEIREELYTSRKSSDALNEAWKKLFSIVGKYRNRDGIIEGNYLSVEELTEVKRLQKVIRDEQLISKKSYGLSIEDRSKIDSIIGKYNLNKYTEDAEGSYTQYLRGLATIQLPDYLKTVDTESADYNSIAIQYNEDIDFLDVAYDNVIEAAKEAELKKSAYSKEEAEGIKALKKELDELYIEKDLIETREPTEYYIDTYEREFEKFKSFNNIENEKEAKSRFENMIPSPNDSEEENFWFRNNNIIVEKWDKASKKYVSVVEPLYSWVEKKPRDEKMIDYNPAYFYYERKAKEGYINKNRELNPFTDDVLPKRGSEYDISKEMDMSKRVVDFRDKFFIPMYAKHQKMTKEVYLRPGAFLRGLEKTKKDRVIEGQVTVKSVKNVFKRAFTSTEVDAEMGLGMKRNKDDINNSKVYGTLPLYGTTRLEKIDMSYNLPEILSRFVASSLLRSELTKEYKRTQTIYNVIKGDDNGLHLDDKKVNSFSRLKNIRSIKTTKNITADAIEEMFKTFYYGEFRRDEEAGSVNLQKLVDIPNMIAAFNTLTWGIPSQIQNVLTAQTQSFIQIHGGELINKRYLIKGHREYAKRAAAFTKDSVSRTVGEMSIESKVIISLGLMQGGSNDIHDGYGLTKAKQFMDSNFGGNYGRQAGEHFTQVTVGYGILTSKVISVEDRNGNKRLINLLDFYEELAKKHGIYRMDDLLENKEVSKDYIISPEDWSQKKQDELSLKILNFNIKINGLYETVLKSVFQKGSLGTLMSMFRKYGVPMGVERLRGQRWNIATNAVSEGMYITFWNEIMRPLFNRRFSELHQSLKDAIHNNPDGQLTESQRENFRKLAAEMSVIMAMGLLTLAIGQDPDDIKEHSFATLYVLYFSKKLKSETEQFIPFPGFGWNEIAGFFKSPSIALSQLSMYNKLFQDLMYALSGDEEAYYQKDTLGFWEEGDSKVLADILALSVGFKGKAFYPEAMISSFSYGQRAR